MQSQQPRTYSLRNSQHPFKAPGELGSAALHQSRQQRENYSCYGSGQAPQGGDRASKLREGTDLNSSQMQRCLKQIIDKAERCPVEQIAKPVCPADRRQTRSPLSPVQYFNDYFLPSVPHEPRADSALSRCQVISSFQTLLGKRTYGESRALEDPTSPV